MAKRERLEQIQTIYNDALALARPERAAFLDKACGNDSALRIEIESLLACEPDAAAYLEKTAINFAAEALAREGAGLWVGRMLGRYQVLSLVGRGGMGDVYCAADSKLNRLVAVKVLPPYLVNDLQRSKRFEQEARTIAVLNHSHICILHDAGHDAGIYYLVFEYLVGELLSDRLSRGAIPLPEALEYATQIAEALEHAHEQGIVHHDLKPRNIMLTKTGVKLLDFGIAELRYPDEPASTEAGTPAYMAPEQIDGRPTDARTDIFAFGMTTYEMIAGRPAFQARCKANETPSLLNDAACASSPAARETLSALDSLVGGCLAQHPSQRWQSISEVRFTLKQIAKDAATRGV